MRSIALSVAAIAAFASSAQQASCGFDVLNELLASPARTSAIDNLDHQVLGIPLAQLRGTGYSIPVVFHVIHDNGPENVPDSILQQCIEQVDLRYQNGGPYADTTGHVVPVNFCLASVDPFGQSTTGITRHQNAQAITSMGQWPLLKNIARWDPYRYLNVWVVRTITDQNVDGYSSFPAELGAASDGVVIEAQYLLNNHLPAHEFGHYLGLYHTFQGYCWNYNCQLDGDHVCDTPPDDSNWFTCLELRCSSETDDTTGLSPFSGDVPELPNYMDYSGCPRSFSQGQADRMAGYMALTRTGLNSSYACGSVPYGPPPSATIEVDSSGCTGRVTFTNLTPNTEFAQWDLGHDGWDAVGPSWTMTFDSTGSYSLFVVVGGPQGCDSLLLNFHVRVAPTAQFPIVSADPGPVVDPWNNLVTACPGDTITFAATPGMQSYLWSTGATTSSITVPITGPFHVSLTTVDSNGLAWNSCAYDTVNVHLAPTITCSPGDTVHCGDNLAIGIPVPADPVSYTWYQNGGLLIGFANVLYTASWNIGTDQYALRLTDNVGCSLWSNTLDITTLPTVPPVITQVGPDLVLDHTVLNMNWYTAAGTPVFNVDVPAVFTNAPPGCYYVAGFDCASVVSDTVCVLSLGLPPARADGTRLYPQPAQGTLWSRPVPPLDTKLMVLDATGRAVLAPSAAELRDGLPISSLPAGSYYLVLASSRGREVLPFYHIP